MRNKQVEKELEQLVDIITEVIPSLKEIRVFGSYITGGWDPKVSDVDIFVESENEFYSAFIPAPYNVGQRDETKERLARRMSKGDWNYDFHVHWFSSGDVRRLSMRNHVRGSLGRTTKAGRLLYPQSELFYEKIDLNKMIPKQILLYKQTTK
nr:nucleotidyltransferase domain-containing protein [Candidatus Woesearchaeota archaeon]